MALGLLGALIIGSLISALGAGAAGAMSYAAQDKANQTNIDLANTAHQREVADLRAAGLNPWLSAGGSGAGGHVVANTGLAAGVKDSTSSIASMLQSIAFIQALNASNSALDNASLTPDLKALGVKVGRSGHSASNPGVVNSSLRSTVSNSAQSVANRKTVKKETLEDIIKEFEAFDKKHKKKDSGLPFFDE